MTFDLENPFPKSGDALRDEAAILLSGRYGRPVIEKRVGGKKVDVYFTEKRFGRETRIFVEAKDYKRVLGRGFVSKVWAEYSGIVEKNRPAILLIVTRNGLATDAEAYVNDEQTEIRHQTIRELENEVLGLGPYIKAQEDIFEKDGLSSYYIESRARRARYSSDGTNRQSDALSVSVFGKIESWIDSEDRRPIAVLGGYGAGKSSLARRMVSHQAKLALADPLSRRPVLIRLGDLWRYSSVEGLLGGMFTHDFPIDGFNVHTFMQMNERGRLLIVLDGFDEMKHAMTWSDFKQQIADLNKLIAGAAKVVLLGRPSAFISSDEHVHVLRGLRKWEFGFRRIPGWPEFIEYDLDDFTKGERSAFIAGYLQHQAKQGPFAYSGSESWISGRVEEVDRLADAEPEIFRKPVHAKLLVDMASDPQVDLSRFAEGITRWGLYDVFFSELAEREMAKPARRPIPETDRLQFLREVALWLWMHRSGAISFAAGDIPDRLLNVLPLGDASDLDAAKREYLTGAFLEKKSGDVFYFGHRSFAEFLVASRMVQNAPGPGEQAAYSRLVRDGVLVFLRDVPDRRRFRAWITTLPYAKGEIHLEYLMFLAEMLGGRTKLQELLPEGCLWRRIIGIFDEEMELGPELAQRIWNAMLTADNDLFFLLLSILQYQAPLLDGRQRDYNLFVAAALLERLFLRAEVDSVAWKAIVEDEDDPVRLLAQAVVPEVRNFADGRKLVFRGSRLLKEKLAGLRMLGFDLVRHPPAPLLSFDDEVLLDLASVIGLMSREGRNRAGMYFERSETLRNVFTRSAPVGHAGGSEGHRPYFT